MWLATAVQRCAALHCFAQHVHWPSAVACVKHLVQSVACLLAQFVGWCRRIAAAGRNQDKLQATGAAFNAQQAHIVSGVDVANATSLQQLAKASTLVLNCVGPYRHYGEPVVKACVEAGTHYVDVCGEPGAPPAAGKSVHSWSHFCEAV